MSLIKKIDTPRPSFSEILYTYGYWMYWDLDFFSLIISTFQVGNGFKIKLKSSRNLRWLPKKM